MFSRISVTQLFGKCMNKNITTYKKKITTYEELQEEKKRLENLLVLHKHEIHANWDNVKLSLTPVSNTVSFFGKFTHKNKSNPLLNMGINLAGDLLLKRFFLRKAGWMTRLLVPFVIKNYSSHVLANNSKGILGKLKNIFGNRKHTNGKMSDVTTDWPHY